MSTASRRRLVGVLATAAVLAASGTAGVVAVLAASGTAGVVAALDTSGTGGRAPARTPAAENGPSPAARALVSPARHSLSLVAPARNRPAGLAGRAAAPATQARGLATGALPSATRALPSAISKPPPVADGIKRFNVAAAHSPQLLRELSGPLSKTSLPGKTRAPSGTSTPGRTITPGPGAAPAAAPAMVRGVDVAAYQHPNGAAIDWARVARAGYTFASIKATEGNYYTNPYDASDLARAKAAGMYVTGYHFAIPSVSGGASQAKYAVDHGRYAADGRTLPLALDIEYNPYGAECYKLTAARMVSWISAFTREVRRPRPWHHRQRRCQLLQQRGGAAARSGQPAEHGGNHGPRAGQLAERRGEEAASLHRVRPAVRPVDQLQRPDHRPYIGGGGGHA